MNLEISELNSFAVLAKELHFGRASNRVFLSQPALSKQIRRLEDKVGGALFARTRRKVELTEAGRVLLPYAEKVLREAAQALSASQRAAQGLAGTLRIGFGIASVFEIVPRTVVRFRKAFPLVGLQMQDMTTPSQIESLVDGRIDIGILRLPVVHAELDSLLLDREHFVAVIPKSFPYNKREGLACLRDAPFILFDSVTFLDRAFTLCRRAGFTPRVVQETNEIFTILNLVRAGLGVSLLPSTAMKIRVSGIKFHELRSTEAEYRIGIAWNRSSEKRDLISHFTTVARRVADNQSTRQRKYQG
jgi:DNA-binding transcriptional LysR family regulator